MELFALDRNFQKVSVIDNYASLIWTERYYGDSEVELTLPFDSTLISMLPAGTFLGMDESDEVMLLETVNLEDNLKVKGKSILSWLDNRFIRASAAHEDRYLTYTETVGKFLWDILYYFTNPGSPYLDGTINIGVINPELFAIPGLGLNAFDNSGDQVTIAVPYGPLYKALKDIASTYEMGMSITLDEVTDTSYFLGFRSYKGLDRTSSQSDNPIVRFSPEMDSFVNIKELQSIAAFETLAYAFAPGNPDGLATTPGYSSLSLDQYTGFDLRAVLVFAEDITTDQVGGDPAVLVNILNNRAQQELISHPYVKAVDGEIVPESQFKYGVHYNLGDIIEVQGNSGTVNAARVTEYIRANDATGLKEYPTVTIID
jgi:hypothetical protein